MREYTTFYEGTKEDIEKVNYPFPPDYCLDGADVLEMIRNFPENTTILKNLRKHEMAELYNKDREINNPNRKVYPITSEILEILYLAVKEMEKLFEEAKTRIERTNKKKRIVPQYTVEDYMINLSLHIECDIVVVSARPKESMDSQRQ